MRGTELTEEQIQAARQFCIDCRKDGNGDMPDDDELIVITFGQLARLVAWYGAIRFIAARDGVGGTLENTGSVIRVRCCSGGALER